MKPKCLILGGLGFIGKNLFLALYKAGYETTLVAPEVNEHDPFVAAHHKKGKILAGSILDEQFLHQTIRDYNIIFSFAGISGAADSVKDPYHDLNTNLRGHLNILEVCRKQNPQALLIFPSTRLVYGKPVYNPVDEKHPIQPESVYAIHKHTVENYYLMYQRIHKLNCVIFRISNPFGPHQAYGSKHHGILNLLIHKAIKDKQIEIYGDGLQKRDFLFIDDLSALFIQAMNRTDLYGNIFNVGYGQGISLADVGQLVAKYVPGTGVLQKPWPEIDKKIETGDYISDITHIHNLTSWSPGVSFEQGIQATVEFYKSHAL